MQPINAKFASEGKFKMPVGKNRRYERDSLKALVLLKKHMVGLHMRPFVPGGSELKLRCRHKAKQAVRTVSQGKGRNISSLPNGSTTSIQRHMGRSTCIKSRCRRSLGDALPPTLRVWSPLKTPPT
eukprot:2902595-Amphidinium_carterae.2